LTLASSECESIQSQRGHYFPAIDGLRAIAVTMVLVFHFDLLSPAQGGFAGVDVFFVISGFLITLIVDQKIVGGNFSLSTFYLSRIRRLAPSLFVTLLIVFLGGVIWLYPPDLVELTKQIIVSQTYVSNIYFWRTLNYFGITSGSAFLLHTWSLAVEEQFYAIYPLFLLALHRIAGRYVWWGLFGVFVASFSLNVVFVSTKPEATFYLLPTRAWELLMGALIVRFRVSCTFSGFVSQAVGFLGLAFVGLSLFGYQKEFLFPGFFALLPTVGAALVIAASTTGKPTRFSTLMSNPVATYVGKISYPLYLVHWPLYIFAVDLSADKLNAPARWLLLTLAFLIASAIFHFLEEPVRRRRILRSAEGLRAWYVTGVATTLLVCGATYATSGIPQRYDPKAVRLANFASDRTADLVCQFRKGTIDASSFCRIGVKVGQPIWLVYGDSHAWAAYAAFDKWLMDRGQSGLFIFRQACPPIIGVHLFHDPGCFEFNEEMQSFLAKTPFIKNVLLVSTWLQAREGLLSNSESIASSDNESISLFEQQFLATVVKLKQLGKHVVIWEPVPGTKRNAPFALAAAYPKDSRSIEFTEEQYRARFDFFFEALDRSKRVIDATVSPSEALCSSGYCSATIDGNPAYFDNGHIASSNYVFWAGVLASSVPSGKFN
jgi:peptidoglycan/LPS O-acetylase OafA/YrhL